MGYTLITKIHRLRSQRVSHGWTLLKVLGFLSAAASCSRSSLKTSAPGDAEAFSTPDASLDPAESGPRPGPGAPAVVLEDAKSGLLDVGTYQPSPFPPTQTPPLAPSPATDSRAATPQVSAVDASTFGDSQNAPSPQAPGLVRTPDAGAEPRRNYSPAYFSPNTCEVNITHVSYPFHGLQEPLEVVMPPLSLGSQLVLERVGFLRIVRDGSILSKPFLDLRSSILLPNGARSVALHPRFAENGRFFVSYIRSAQDPYSKGNNGDVVLAEGHRSVTTPDEAEPALKALLVVEPLDGVIGDTTGKLLFGPDGFLYYGVATGESVGGDPTGAVAQDPRSKLGKILRLDVDRPDLTPLPGNLPGADSLVWAMGLRAPAQFSFDIPTGDIFIVDYGLWGTDEINYVRGGDTSRRNFGWKIMEGRRCYGPPVVPPPACDPTGFTPPVFVNPYLFNANRETTKPENASHWFSGGTVYRGSAIPCLKGRYVFASARPSPLLFSGMMQNGALIDLVEHHFYPDSNNDFLEHTTIAGSWVNLVPDRDGELLIVNQLGGNILKIEKH